MNVLILRYARLLGALVLCCAVRAAAIPVVKPLALQRTRYEMRAGQPVAVAAPADTLDFLLKAKSRTVQIAGAEPSGLVVSPNRTGDQLMLAAPSRTPPGEYTARISATSETGEERAATVSVVVQPRQKVPTGSARPPVVLLNGWETGFTGTCPVTTDSETFGNLAQYLVSDGVPIVYFFDNCAEAANATIETLGAHLGTFLNTVQYTDGTQVPQIDLIGFSMGGLIARAYLAGMQDGGAFTPPATPLVRDLILIATPNFGSFAAGNYINSITTGTQSAELIPASAFLWNLATWNQRGDDLRGVNALAIAGNAGSYLATLSSTTGLANASDGLVTVTSAALGFALPGATPTQVVPYCHIDPSTFTNTSLLGTFACTAAGIANVTSTTQQTGAIVRSFLSGTDDWKSIGTVSTKDAYLSIDGGIYFAMQNQSGSYITDMTQVTWGTVPLVTGGNTNTVYYTDFVNGTGAYQAISSSQGTVHCGTLKEDIGYFSAARCKINSAIFSVGPLAKVPGRIVNSGSTITITGNDFGSQCSSCQVLAIPNGSSTQTALTVSSWTNTSISAMLPASMAGLLTIQVKAVPGTDAITIMAAPAGPTLAATPASLPFAYTIGGTVPAAQIIQISNGGSGTLTWTAAASDTWLSLSDASGTAPSTLSVSISPAGLSSGTYNGTVTITAAGAAPSPMTVAVTLTVTTATASLSVTPPVLTYNYTAGGTAPAAQSISITSSGGALSWTASSSVFWAIVSATSGPTPATLTVLVNPANIAAGTYTGNVQIASAGAAGSPASVTLTLVVTGTQAAPAITSVSNAGSFQPGFAAATWVSIFGTNLSASTQVWQASDFVNGLLPTSLQGVSATINGVPAFVFYISPTQINVLAPDDPATGAVQVQVTTAGQQSDSLSVQKQQYAPAWFTFANGQYVAAQHADYSDVGKAGLFTGVTTTPAKPGEVILLYGTGFGPTDPATPTNQLVTVPYNSLPANAVQITIGGLAAAIQFAGVTGSGLYQFNVTVPSLPDGDAAVVATVGGVSTQSGVSVTIQQ